MEIHSTEGPKRFIAVTEHTVPIGEEYQVTKYPGPGVYSSRTTSTLFVVAGTCVTTIVGLPASAIQTLSAAPVQVDSLRHGLSEDFVLKALAIAQQPSLAPSLIHPKPEVKE